MSGQLERRLPTTAEVEAALEVSRATVHRLIAAGVLMPIRYPHRDRLRIPSDQVQTLLEGGWEDAA